jgi:hypothetical protein
VAKELDNDNKVDASTLQSETPSKTDVTSGTGVSQLLGNREDEGGPDTLQAATKDKWKHTGRGRVISRGSRAVARTSETTSGIPEGTIDIEPETKVTIPVTDDPQGKALFTAAGPGSSKSGYGWFESLGVPNNRHIGLTCDVPGGTYSHGEGGPEGTHFLSSAKDNPFTTTPYVLCNHHYRLKQIQHASDPNIRLTPIKAQDVEKHLAKVEAINNSRTGSMEGALRTGGYSVALPFGEQKPPKNVVVPPEDLLWGQETETKGARSGAVRGGTPSFPTPDYLSHLPSGDFQSRENNGWLGSRAHLEEVNTRRSNAEKEDTLTAALERLRSTNTPDDEEHMQQYHSSDSVLPKDDNGREYCPTCSDIYSRTVENLAKAETKKKKKTKPYKFSPVDQAGNVRLRNSGQTTEDKPPRIGQSLPKESDTRESVPYGNLTKYAEAVVPAHMLVNDPLTGRRPVTPVEKFAEEQLTKQSEELSQDAALDAIAEKGRRQEAFKRMSTKERAALTRNSAFRLDLGPKEIEGPTE